MDWCALPREKANHPPVAVVNGIPGKDVIETDAQPGQVVRLSAEGSSDPDGDRISCRWFQYPEAGTSRARVELETPATSRTAFAAPAADQPGAVHVILEVRDSGDPALYAYRRVIVRVRSLEAFPGTTPVLDGVLSPGEWDDATTFTGPPNWVPQFSPTTDPKDLSLRGWVKHDGKRLYFGFDVTDDVLYGIDTPRWLPDNNPQAHELTPQGFPWFGDMMELLINAANRWRGEEGARGDGASWQMVCNLTKSRLHGIGTGGLMEGEPRRDPQAWANYQKWILSGAQQAVAKPKSGGRGYVIEWAVSFDPCLEVEPGRFYSTALGDRPMGLNIALGDLDEKERGAGNFGNFHHEDWFSGARNVRTQLRHWGTLWMRAAPR
jgi:SSS family solute:Na+ symporter